MPGTDGFQFNAEKVEKSFSTLQPVDDSVQAADSPTPGCCSRTSLSLSCRSFERGYNLELPLKSKQANETPFLPPQNRQLHVMAVEVEAPFLQVLSVREGNEVAEITVSAQGPNQCPPGKPNTVKIQGIGGGSRDVPFAQWSWKAPAILDARLMQPLNEDMIALLHPFKAPCLPAQVWSLSVPGCPASKLKTNVIAFPDVQWHGRVLVKAVPKPGTDAGFETIIEGDLVCRYNGNDFKIDTRDQAHALSRWFEIVEMLAKCAVAIMALRPGPKYAGFDHARLEKYGALRLEPWPQLSLQVDSALFEQQGNGLLGHALKVLIYADPLVSADGEVSLLPMWLEDSTKKGMVAPLLAGLDVVRTEEVAQELGLWLVVQGRSSLRSGIEARRPIAATQVLARASGGISLNLEARSVREYDAFVIQCGGVEDRSMPAGLQIACEPAPESPLQEPLDKKTRVLLNFTGCAIGGIEKWRPGCRYRRWQPLEAKPPGALPVLPARSWPSGGEPGQLVEIPWSD